MGSRIVLVAILLSLFYSGTKAQIYNKLVISCDENILLTKDSLKVRISYFNASSDTIVLPLYAMNVRNFLEFRFDGNPDSTLCCGWVSDYIVTKNNCNCNCYTSKIDELLVISPMDTATVIYDLNKLGYHLPMNTNKGSAFEFDVILDLPKWFENVCNNMWTGVAKSNTSHITIK